MGDACTGRSDNQGSCQLHLALHHHTFHDDGDGDVENILEPETLEFAGDDDDDDDDDGDDGDDDDDDDDYGDNYEYDGKNDDEHEDQIRVRVDARLLRRVTGQLQPKDPPDTLKHQHHYQACKVISSS